jgi:orotate phosphoribosyltransferase
MEQADVVRLFKETEALLSGHFELRSGLHSDQYFQCALLLQHPLIAERLCAEAVRRLKELPDGPRDVAGVIAPALGGIPVGHEVARALGVKSIFAEKKDDGLILRRGFRIEKGERWVVAEDVITRGGRVQQTIDIVRQEGGEVAGIVVLVDRSGENASFDAGPVVSLVQMTPTVWEPEACPLCEEGIPIDHPGS